MKTAAPSEVAFLALLDAFIERRTSAGEFVHDYMELWRLDRDVTHAFADSWSSRLDLKLLEDRERGVLTEQEFQVRWASLWEQEGRESIESLKSQVFTACDVYSPYPEGEFEIGPDQLRIEVAQIRTRWRGAT